MSLVRWTGTTVGMAAVAWALRTAGPGAVELRATLAAPQAAVDLRGPDALLVVLAAAVAWLVWLWGAAGLLLTALSALPGLPGRLAALVAAAVLPENARRAAALALGLSLGVTAPLAVGGARSAPAPAATTVHPAAAAAPLPDWPAAAAVPDWPADPAASGHPGDRPGDHVVAPGDCLWDVARTWLDAGDGGRTATDGETARAVSAWWQANAEVIGPDPDLLLPGQVLHPPAPDHLAARPDAPGESR
jgi:hypothetical protein